VEQYFGYFEYYALRYGVIAVAAVLSVPWLNPRSHRRFAAALIDLAIAGVGYYGWTVASALVGPLGAFPAQLVPALYLVLRDVLSVPSDDSGGSPGKRIMRVHLVRRDGGPASAERAIARNLPLLAIVILLWWPSPIARYAYPAAVLVELMLAWLAPAGRRLGALIAGTEVRPEVV